MALTVRTALAPDAPAFAILAKQYVFSAKVGMARCAVPARVVAGGTNIRATQPFEGAAPPNTARTSRQRPQTARTGRGLHTAPTPDPSAARLDVAQVAKVAEGGGVDACIPAQRRGKLDNSLWLNDPPNIDRPSINRNLQSALEVPCHQHLATKISPLEVSYALWLN